MTDTAYIALLVSTNATLVGALIWYIKTDRKDRKDLIERCIQSLNENTNSFNAVTRVMEKVINLLNNWRGH